MVAKTYLGLEAVLAEELEALGAKEIREISRGVQFMGDEAMMYAANLHLRTATRVLVLLNRFRARNEENLQRSVMQTDWSALIGLKDSLSVDAQVQSDFFQNTGQTSLKVKDAIVDQVKAKTGRRPNTNALHPTIRVHISVFDQDISLYVDSSGDSLVWRGWRISKEEGAYTDALTAGMILLSGWRGEGPWLDGQCGNGQSLVEAAMIAARIAPGLSRTQFAFQRFSDYNPEVFNAVREKAVAMQRKPKIVVQGWDRSPMTLRIAERHFQAAGVSAWVKTQKGHFQNDPAPGKEGELFLRLTEENRDYYDMLCGLFKTRYDGWTASIVAPDVPSTKFLGLRPADRVLLSDGPKQYRWSLFKLYEGSEEPEPEPKREFKKEEKEEPKPEPQKARKDFSALKETKKEAPVEAKAEEAQPIEVKPIEAKPEPKPESKPEQEFQPEIKPAPQPEQELKPEIQPVPWPEPDEEPELEAKPARKRDRDEEKALDEEFRMALKRRKEISVAEEVKEVAPGVTAEPEMETPEFVVEEPVKKAKVSSKKPKAVVEEAIVPAEEPVKKAKAPSKKAKAVADEVIVPVEEPVKKAKAPSKKAKAVVDEAIVAAEEPVKKTKAPSKKAKAVAEEAIIPAEEPAKKAKVTRKPKKDASAE